MRYRVREIREAKGMPQYLLSQKSGVSRATIWAIEKKDDHVTTTSTLVKIADALGVDIDDLFLARDAK